MHRNSDEMVPYEGSKSHVPTYNFCYLCKERLDTYHDEQDEGWYFVNTKQIRFSSSAADQQSLDGKGDEKLVVNVHTTCLKEIEMNSKQDKMSGSKSMAAKSQQSSSQVKQKEEAIPDSMKLSQDQEVTLIGQKRPYVEYEKYQEQNVDEFSGLQGIISGMESQKTKKQQTSGIMWSQSS